MYISVLNFENKTVDVIYVDSKTNPSHNDIESILEFRGYNVNSCQYMVTDTISVNVL